MATGLNDCIHLSILGYPPFAFFLILVTVYLKYHFHPTASSEDFLVFWMGVSSSFSCDMAPSVLSYVCHANSTCSAWNSMVGEVHHSQFGCNNVVIHGKSAHYHAAISKLQDEKLSQGSVSGVLTLGPNTLEEDHQELLRFIEIPSRMIFVEANPAVIPHLHRNVELLGFSRNNTKDVNVMNRAVCVNGEESIILYVDGEGDASKIAHILPNSHQTLFNKLQNEKAITQSVVVPCISPEGILESVGLAPDDIDVLLIDLEGLDLHVLEMLMAMDGFRPKVIKFEWHVVHMQAVFEDPTFRGLNKVNLRITRLLQKLSSKGYTTVLYGVDMISIRSDYYDSAAQLDV